MENKTVSIENKSVVILKAEGRKLQINDTKTGSTVILTFEDGKVIRDFSGCKSTHDYQYAGCIANFLAGVTTKYMNKRLGWKDRIKKIEKVSNTIDAKSIRNLSSKMRVTFKPMFNIPEDLYFSEQVKKVKVA